MRGRRSHIEIACFLGLVLAVLIAWNSPVYAQTAPGTRILNAARGVFHYKTGARDSVRSNTTETLVQAVRTAAASIYMSASPDAIVGNGTDTASVTVNLLDVSGNPVTDGTIVFLVTTAGTFPGGKDTISLPTVNGLVKLQLISAIVSQQIVAASVTATTIGEHNQELSAGASLLFFPGAVFGSVSSAATGQPVSGAVVVVSNESQNEQGRDTTAANGRYLIPVSSAGTYAHTITYRNRYGDQVKGVFHELLPIPARGGIPPMGGLNAIAGNVIDRGTGNPVRQAGIHVTISKVGKVDASSRNLPAIAITDARGVFLFDSLSPGVYEIRANESSLAGTATLYDTLANSFLVDASLGVSEVPALQVVKTSNKRIAEIGDAVAYLLEIRNTSATAMLTGVRIVDDLPLGFQYAAGSSRHERSEIADPSGSRRLEWVLSDTLEPGKSTRLSYMTTIGSASMDGDGINRAYGMAHTLTGDSVRSPIASACVVVRPGIFTDHGIVIGKIFFEENENGLQEFGEKGIAGVELWMEDGTHVITGDDGKYSLPDVKPGQHVIRVDRRTLPAGSVVLATETESAGDGTSRFIRLVDGGVARADFRIRPPHQASLDASVSPSPSTGRMRALFVVRFASAPVPVNVVLTDTLPKGLFYDLQSLTLNGSPLGGPCAQSRSLYLELPVRQPGSFDTLRVEIGRDSAYFKRVGVMRPKLVLSYPQRREAVFGTVETFPVPTMAPATPTESAALGGARSQLLRNNMPPEPGKSNRPQLMPSDETIRPSGETSGDRTSTPQRKGGG